MGLFLQTAIIPDCNEAAVRDTVASVAKKYSRQFETADGNTASEYHIIDLIPDACQYYTYEKGVGVLFNEDCMGYESLAYTMAIIGDTFYMTRGWKLTALSPCPTILTRLRRTNWHK